MYGIDIGHRYGRIARRGEDGRPGVATVAFGPGGPDTAAAAVTALADARDVPSQDAVALALPLDEDGERGEGALRRAAEGAGLTVVHTIAEPVAVALHYRAVVEGTNRTVLVFDQGATTLDLAVLAVAHDRTVRIIDAERHPLGGDHWDAAITAGLPGGTIADLGPDEALALAGRLRRALGAPGQDVVTEPVREAGVPLDRETLERCVRPLRERARRAVADLSARTASPPDTILLAGGLAATPGTDEWLESALGLQVRCEDPAHAVVNGLLHLADFGALRVRSGPARHRQDAPTWRREDPEPLSGVRPGGPRARPADPPEDPEPSSRPAEARRSRAEQAPRPAPTPEPSDGPGPEAPGASASFSDEPRAGRAPVSGRRAFADSAPQAPDAPGVLHAVPVDELQAIRRGSHLLVLWAWPPGSRTARVRWRVEGGGVAGSPDTGDIRCLHRVYQHDGGLNLRVGRGAVTLTVEALVAGPAVDCEGSSALLVDAEPPVVEYEPSVRRRLGGRTAIVTFTCDTGCELPALRIVHGAGHYRPSSPAEGTVVHDLPAQRITARVPLRVEFPLPPVRGTSWLVCFPAHPDHAADSDTAPDVRPTALHRLRVT
ncbi:Hsp70 family protein [Streptomyces anulatus]